MSSSESNSNSAPPPPGPRREAPQFRRTGGAGPDLAGRTGMGHGSGPGEICAGPPSAGAAGLPQTAPDFVPSDATEIPGVDLSSLSAAQRNHVLFRLNMEPCPCGCNTSIAACRISHPACPLARTWWRKSSRRSQEPGVRSRKSEARSDRNSKFETRSANCRISSFEFRVLTPTPDS